MLLQEHNENYHECSKQAKCSDTTFVLQVTLYWIYDNSYRLQDNSIRKTKMRSCCRAHTGEQFSDTGSRKPQNTSKSRINHQTSIELPNHSYLTGRRSSYRSEITFKLHCCFQTTPRTLNSCSHCPCNRIGQH